MVVILHKSLFKERLQVCRNPFSSFTPSDLHVFVVLQEVDESGAEAFMVLLPSGTPLPARRHHLLSGEGKLSSFCLEIYQRFMEEQPEKLSKVQK